MKCSKKSIPKIKRTKQKLAVALIEQGAHLWLNRTVLKQQRRSREFSPFLNGLGLSRTDACTAINAFLSFRDTSYSNLEQFASTALRMLGGPSVREDARRAALDRASAGERITVEVAREIITQFRPDRSAKAGSAPPYESTICCSNKTTVIIRGKGHPDVLAALKEALEAERARIETKNSVENTPKKTRASGSGGQ
ncbi:hypothetical protein OAS39_02190 [Pirellulales bacterium]|nr:hypothetical protein [Pirellulales bacterium]